MTRPMSIEVINEYGTPTVRLAVDQHAVLLEADDVDGVIQCLSAIRASMQPEVPKHPSRLQQYVIEMDPCWHTEKNPLLDGAVLFFRHTGLGWAGFSLPQHSLVQLSDALSAHLQKQGELAGLPN
ncbi:hypothetical protein [Paraburkholderia sp.]|uniref:hypothetical protein n=1 Tax=Paraburkholderia sp. TaxID=1926495 RepID=UPI0023875C88|nr:hypothetical protein [Paraburkholderia sp.]MDE1182463.1 hypothetical protein [Paraburkholderia sp.]